MKTRRFPIMILLIGTVLAVTGLALPHILIGAGAAPTGIVGSKESPTLWFLLTHYLHGFPLCLTLLGAAMMLTSLPAVFFINAFQRSCSIKTAAITLCLSIVGRLGLTCAFYLLMIGSLSSPSKHPVGYPLSTTAGALSLVTFILLVCVYFSVRSKKPSILGFVYDVIASIVFTCFFLYFYFYFKLVLISHNVWKACRSRVRLLFIPIR